MKTEDEYIEFALYAVRVLTPAEGKIEEEKERFVQRWGATDIQALQRALHEGGNEDRLIALFALGYSETPESLSILEPYIQRGNLEEQYASAYGLWFSHPEVGFEHLLKVLQTEIPFPFDHDVFWIYIHLIELMQKWRRAKDLRAVSALRQAHVLAEQNVERMLVNSAEKYGPEISLLEDYQDVIAITLGSWRVFNAFELLTLTERRARLARAFLCIGALDVMREGPFDVFMTITNSRKPITTVTRQHEVGQLLQEHFSMTSLEQQRFFEHLSEDYFWRHSKLRPAFSDADF